MYTPLRLTAFFLAAGLTCPAAIASQPSEHSAEGLSPLEARATLVGTDENTSLSEVSARINENTGADSGPSENTLNPQDIPIVRDIVDEEGDVSLPMGLRVYDTMGDMSVGIGSDF